MASTHRREATIDRRALLRGLAAVALVDLASARGALAAPAEDALAEFDARCRALRRGQLSPAQWHEALVEVTAAFDRDALSAWLDLEKLKRSLPLPKHRFGSRKLRLKRSKRLRRLGFQPFLFGLRAGTAIPPHGHENVAALLFVLEGGLRARHWDRVADDDDGVTLRASIDRGLGPGAATWVSDAKDNVHWFQASEPTWALDLAVPEVVQRARGAAAKQRLTFLDIDAARPAGEGRIIAPKLQKAEALKRYGTFS